MSIWSTQLLYILTAIKMSKVDLSVLIWNEEVCVCVCVWGGLCDMRKAETDMCRMKSFVVKHKRQENKKKSCWDIFSREMGFFGWQQKAGGR